MLYRFSSRLLLIGSVFSLASCAYLYDESIQDITVETPGAQDAVCNVYVDKLHYRFKPPQTQNISKSKNDLIVDCYAPGNRHAREVIKPSRSKNSRYNIANGYLPGYAFDAASGALYYYPDTITVDFTDEPLLPEDLPDQNNPDIRQPEEYRLEEFGASTPKLNSDDEEGASTTLKRRERPASDTSSFTDAPSETPGAPVSDKGDLKSVVIPAPPSDGPSTAAPSQLYPGQ